MQDFHNVSSSTVDYYNFIGLGINDKDFGNTKNQDSYSFIIDETLASSVKHSFDQDIYWIESDHNFSDAN